MEKNLYIDASHPEETRVVLKSKSYIEEYESENKNSLSLKNNIYLGIVSRVEPSLQAAFINFGRERHGFLAFNDIQSDYYQIPKSDLEIIKQEEEKAREELSKEVEAKEEKNLTDEFETMFNSLNLEEVIALKLELAAKETKNIYIFDPFEKFCDVEYCYTEKEGVFLYSDDDHLSKEGALLISGDLISMVANINANKR